MRRHPGHGFLFALCVAALAAAPADAAPAPAGKIVYLEGEVAVDRVPARIGQPVPSGAVVQTGPASVCEITWGNRNIIQVQENTRVVLGTARFAPGLDLERGSVAAVLNKLDAITGRNSFRIRTPSAVAGVRGTAFFVKVEDAGSTYVCACNGAVDVTRGLGRQAELASSAHMARRFAREGLATRITEPGLLYHDNAAMDRLAQKIGYAIPWGQGEYGAGNSGTRGLRLLTGLLPAGSRGPGRYIPVGMSSQVVSSPVSAARRTASAFGPYDSVR